MSAIRLDDVRPDLEMGVAGQECGLEGEEGGVGVIVREMEWGGLVG